MTELHDKRKFPACHVRLSPLPAASHTLGRYCRVGVYTHSNLSPSFFTHPASHVTEHATSITSYVHSETRLRVEKEDNVRELRSWGLDPPGYSPRCERLATDMEVKRWLRRGRRLGRREHDNGLSSVCFLAPRNPPTSARSANPRSSFFIHTSIQSFASDIVARYGKEGSKAFLFPTRRIAERCLVFVKSIAPPEVAASLDTVHLVLDKSKSPAPDTLTLFSPAISAVLCSPEGFPYVKQYWQHTGDGVSSRRAEFCHGLFKDGLLRLDEETTTGSFPASPKPCRGPKRYQRTPGPETPKTTPSPGVSPNGGAGLGPDIQETNRFLEERFGRNLDVSFVEPARSAIKRRIAGALRSDRELTVNPPPEGEMESNTRGIASLREEDVYLFPCGMSAIFNSHRALLGARGNMKSINVGFPYVDTLKILEKFGPGCVFYGHASESDLDDLEKRLEGGERFLALFCEFPGNPLLTCPNLVRIRQLADRYDFAVVVDETIGTFANINVLPFADIVVSSLTKIFSGDCNVMGGSAVFNPNGRYYAALKEFARAEYEDTYWPEDVMFMERNSRDFVSRIDRINANAEAICNVFRESPLIKSIFYPKYNRSRPNYDACKLPGGGYGGLLSVVFHRRAHAVAFYDAVETAKGPSLGTNFTLTSPYVLLAHYQELDWAESFGVERDLVRISVGLEETEHIVKVFQTALKVAEDSGGK